jgi:hypothetical protein
LPDCRGKQAHPFFPNPSCCSHENPRRWASSI